MTVESHEIIAVEGHNMVEAIDLAKYILKKDWDQVYIDGNFKWTVERI
jgi:hypothetical protein